MVVGAGEGGYVLRKCDRIPCFTFDKGATATIMSLLQHLLSRGYTMSAGGCSETVSLPIDSDILISASGERVS